jgi:4-hydroxybenzoate polyprenyltransferase
MTRRNPSITTFVRLARPHHWIKNVIVLFPVVSSLNAGNPMAWARAGLAAAAFCLLSSAVYVVNDIHDRRRDRLHPLKRDRPLAAGTIGVRPAALAAGILAVLGVGLGAMLNPLVLALMAAYLLLQTAYTFFLKQRMLADVIAIGLGFVLRAAAGAAALGVEISPWLFVCTLTVCMFMGFCKRCNEIVTMDNPAEAEKHRSTLTGYTSELLTHLITLAASIAIISFLLYAMSDSTVARIGSDLLVYTLPVVIYAISRFAMLSMRGRYANPTDLILHDGPFQAAVGLWLLASFVIIYWGQQIEEIVRNGG